MASDGIRPEFFYPLRERRVGDPSVLFDVALRAVARGDAATFRCSASPDGHAVQRWLLEALGPGSTLEVTRWGEGSVRVKLRTRTHKADVFIAILDVERAIGGHWWRLEDLARRFPR